MKTMKKKVLLSPKEQKDKLGCVRIELTTY